MVKDGYNWPEHFNIGVLKVPGLETPDVVKKWTRVLAQDTGMNVHLAYSTDNSKATKFKWLHYGIIDLADGGGLEFRRLLKETISTPTATPVLSHYE